jgi:phosphatidate phosphatase PAH1
MVCGLDDTGSFMKGDKQMYGKLTNIPLKLLPKGEDLFVFHMDEQGFLRYVITAKPNRETWFLYEFTGDALKRLGKGTNPNQLEEKYIPWCKK